MMHDIGLRWISQQDPIQNPLRLLRGDRASQANVPAEFPVATRAVVRLGGATPGGKRLFRLPGPLPAQDPRLMAAPCRSGRSAKALRVSDGSLAVVAG